MSAAGLALALVLAVPLTRSGDAPGGPEGRVEGEYIVELVDRGVSRTPVRRALQGFGVAEISALETNQALYVVVIDEDPGPSAVKDALAGVEGVVLVQPNFRYQATGTGGEPGTPSPGQ